MTGSLELDMKNVKRGERLYLQMSGGIDSTYLAWRLLKEGYRLLVWHCSFQTHQKRWPHEDRAYANIIAWLRGQGFDSIEELPQGIYAGGKAIVGWRLDYTFLWPEAGFHLRKTDHRQRPVKDRQDIRYIVIPDHAQSLSMDTPPLRSALETMNRNAGRQIGRIHPMKRFTKAQVLEDMPLDLIDLCWWCRKPNGNEPCHKCDTCKKVDAALQTQVI